MEPTGEVIVPNFVNPHLFWIVPKKNILLRSVFNKILHTNPPKRVKDFNFNESTKDKMVAVNIGDLWARALIENIVKFHEESRFLCWLLDYGLMQSVTYVFDLPDELQKCPHLAKQASLYNVVNLRTDLKLGDDGYKVQFEKTTEVIPGIRTAALNCIDDAQKILFSFIEEDEFNMYGDIICIYQDNARESLTTHLLQNKLMDHDEFIFKTIETSRCHLKKVFFNNSSSWQQEIKTIEKKKLSTIFSNHDKSISMDFFKRMATLDELLLDG